MISAPFLSAAQAHWSACPTWKTDPMLENRGLKNSKSISNVLHLGLALLVFLGKIFHILAFLDSRRKLALSSVLLHTWRGGKGGYVPCEGASHKLLLCAHQGSFQILIAPLLAPFWSLPVSSFWRAASFSTHRHQCSSASSGTWAQQPPARSATSPALSLHSTFMPQAPFETQRRMWTSSLLPSVRRCDHTVSFYHH